MRSEEGQVVFNGGDMGACIKGGVGRCAIWLSRLFDASCNMPVKYPRHHFVSICGV